MDENLSRQILDDLLPSLEALDTKASALLQLLKDKGIATPEEMAAYLDRAANASNVRWRAARVRLDYLLSSAAKPQEEAVEKKEDAAEKKSPQSADHPKPVSEASEEEKDKKDKAQEKTNTETTATGRTPAAQESTDGEPGAKEKAAPEPNAEKEKAKAGKDTGDPAPAAA